MEKKLLRVQFSTLTESWNQWINESLLEQIGTKKATGPMTTPVFMTKKKTKLGWVADKAENVMLSKSICSSYLQKHTFEKLWYIFT